MQPIWLNAAVLAVAGIYYLYRAYQHALQRRQRHRLAERVAYMLWLSVEECADVQDIEAGTEAVP
jgi:hypothetical protein